MKAYEHRREKKEKKYNRTIALSDEDIIRDYSHIAKLKVSESRRDWIENTMYELRAKSNKYERKLLQLLKVNKIAFIHQAPFIIDGKIYFADFFLPKENLIIEIDGISHDNNIQKQYDKQRDAAFGSYKIKTIRLSNDLVSDKKRLIQILPMLKKKEISSSNRALLG
jgi:very-short-patch-repair endonuclease